jgi:penicillin-binding protein 1A
MPRTGNRQKNHLKRTLVLFCGYVLVFVILIAVAAYVSVARLSEGLPNLEDLERETYNQALSSTVYSADGEELRTFKEEERYWVTHDRIPQCMIDALLAAEDSRFENHWGVSVPDIMRAIVANLKTIRPALKKSFPFIVDFHTVQGASTLTQQLARDLFLDREQTLERKLLEQLLAVKIEHTYSKPEIIEFFLNRMFMGNNSHGIQAAARGYFGKDASELDISESALLAGILQAPSTYNPRSTANPRTEQLAIAKRRRDIVIRMMYNNGAIPLWQANEEISRPIELNDGRIEGYGRAPYFVDYVANIIQEQYGEDFLKTAGASVYTTLDFRAQQIAEDALRERLDLIQNSMNSQLEYERPEWLTGAEAEADSISKTVVQGALVAMDIKTGRIIAMVGGREYSETNMFNRAVDARRQAGSSFKPFLYTAALDNGWRTCDTIYDGYVSYSLPNGDIWEPRNYGGTFEGILSIRDGFKKSQNVIAVKLMNDAENRGIGASNVVKYAKMLGITTRVPPYMSIAVGTPEVRLIEMTAAYATFPSLGIHTEPIGVYEVYDKNGRLQNRTTEGVKTHALKPELASLMLTMFRSVAREGTASGWTASTLMKGRPFGGKTGTAQEFKDTWFIGFTPYIVCGVWIGFDSEETTLENYNTGATAPLPVWAKFIAETSEMLGYPMDKFDLARTGLTTDRICKVSYKRATQFCPSESVYSEYFLEGTELTESCDEHGPNRQRPTRRLF